MFHVAGTTHTSSKLVYKNLEFYFVTYDASITKVICIYILKMSLIRSTSFSNLMAEVLSSSLLMNIKLFPNPNRLYCTIKLLWNRLHMGGDSLLH